MRHFVNFGAIVLEHDSCDQRAYLLHKPLVLWIKEFHFVSNGFCVGFRRDRIIFRCKAMKPNLHARIA